MNSSRPKVLHAVAGLPLVAHVARSVRAINPSSVIAVTSPDGRAEIAEAAGGVQCIDQPVPMGTGHALATALIAVPHATRHVLVMNGDVPLVMPETVRALAALHEKRRASVTLLGCTADAEDFPGVGRLRRGARGKPVGVSEADEEDAARSGAIEVNVGVYAFEVGWLRNAVSELRPHASGEYYLTDLIARAVADGRRVEAHATTDTDEALSINGRGDLARAEAAAQRRLREAAMAAGATLIDPATTYLEAMVELSRDVTVHPNTAIRGRSRVGAGAEIGPNAQVRDATIGAGSRVDAAVVHGAVLDAGVSVGPFAHVRAGTVLEGGAYVGSHAEIKASRIGPGAHIGHFSYVGDAVVGANANIGAGTVTCNYDGVEKHATEIGEGAFIGSDSLLIAPVRVGAGAVTGAGAVVNRDVPPGGRVAGVPARALGSRHEGALAASEGGRSLG